MTNLNTILTIIISLLTIFDWVSNNKIIFEGKLWFLTMPIIDLSILRIILLILVLVLISKIFPISKIFQRIRANHFYQNWLDFKKIIEEYSKTNNLELNKKYSYLQEKLMQDFHFFNKKIIELQSQTHKEHIPSTLRAFEQCFSIRNIENWEQEVRRVIPRELDCFDYLLIGLKENI